MTHEELQAIEAAAKAAVSKGPWKRDIGNDARWVHDTDGRPVAKVYNLLDGSFVALASPSTILALLAERTRLEEQWTRTNAEYERVSKALTKSVAAYAMLAKLWDAVTEGYPCVYDLAEEVESVLKGGAR